MIHEFHVSYQLKVACYTLYFLSYSSMLHVKSYILKF